MPEDGAVISQTKVPWPHGAYILGTAETIQMVRMVRGEERVKAMQESARLNGCRAESQAVGVTGQRCGVTPENGGVLKPDGASASRSWGMDYTVVEHGWPHRMGDADNINPWIC